MNFSLFDFINGLSLLVGCYSQHEFFSIQDLSDAQWRNFRGNLPVLTAVIGVFTTVANVLRRQYHLKERGMSIIWILLSLSYLFYLHGAWYASLA